MTKAQELLNLVATNEAKINVIDTERNVMKETTNKLQWQIKDTAYNQIREIERKRDSDVAVIQKQTDSNLEVMQQTIEELIVPEHQVQRILAFLALTSEKDLTVDTSKIVVRESWKNNIRPAYKEDLGYLYSDNTTVIKLVIISNDKPKNKYALVAVGKRIFTENLLQPPRSYGLNFYVTGDSFAIEAPIREDESIEKLREWVNKYKPTILAEYIEKTQQLKAEYEQILKDYSVEDFMSVITDICPKCGKFVTKFENYGRRNEAVHCYTCNVDMNKTGVKGKYQ